VDGVPDGVAEGVGVPGVGVVGVPEVGVGVPGVGVVGVPEVGVGVPGVTVPVPVGSTVGLGVAVSVAGGLVRAGRRVDVAGGSR
jgi:hypothetical protein